MNLPNDYNVMCMYRTTKTGSHIILKTLQNGEHSLSVPNHKPLKLGTLNALFNAIADHLELDKQKVIEHLLSRR